MQVFFFFVVGTMCLLLCMFLCVHVLASEMYSFIMCAYAYIHEYYACPCVCACKI
jgi:hypothetical protein